MKKYNVCIVGGGSTYTLGFLKSFARMQEEFPLNKLVLFDIDGERQKPIGQYGDIMFAERYPELDFSYTTDPKEAYQDMDFIFMQMRAGGLHMRQKDEHIPLSFGKVGQETCGAGGMAYGLDRMVMLMAGKESIRDVIAFPKVKDSGELMVQSPDKVDEKQLRELGLAITKQVDKTDNQ